MRWSADDAVGAAYDVTIPGVWDELYESYTGGVHNQALTRIIGIARGHGVRSVVVEQRYADRDWRSEYGAFHIGLFRRRPSIAHRWHFFTDDVPSDLSRLRAEAYRGYVVLRPVESAPVGRTLITPPAETEGAVLCEARERVSVFGHALEARGMPFLGQDGEFLRCAHTAVWMVLRHAHLVHGVARSLTADVHAAATSGRVVGRQLPSDGLSVEQMMTATIALGLSPGVIDLTGDRDEDAGSGLLLSLEAILSRYVNSQMPPVVLSRTHGWVIVGYRREPGSGRIVFWRHDDHDGPYARVADPRDEPDESHRPWQAAVLPLLSEVYVTAERAEAAGRLWFSGYLRQADEDEPVARAAAARSLVYRTYVSSSATYLEQLADRGLDPEVTRLLRLAALPPYVWVVEAVDARAWDEARPDVVGEVVLDATASTHHEPLQEGLIALYGGRLAHRLGPDHGSRREVRVDRPRLYRSGVRPPSGSAVAPGT